MRWNDLIARLPIHSQGGAGNPDILDVTCDSRAVASGALYVSIPGLKVHGDVFIADAVARGASAVLSENAQNACGVPWGKVDNTRKILGVVGKTIWAVDASRVVFVGITGTNGKTTTAYLFQNLLGLVYGKTAVWMFGTVLYATGEEKTPARRTTPESADIFRSIGKARRKPKAVVMEVSSHALALDRIAGLSFDLAIWTNFTQDHLDFHSSMDDYYRAKKRLFTEYLGSRGRAIINIDDPWGKRLSNELGNISQVTFGKSPDARVRIVHAKSTGRTTEIALNVDGNTVHLASGLAGYFNVYNMTALVAGARALSIDMDTVKRSFETMGMVPGRMERVDIEADFSVFVDYAHTPDALDNMLASARSLARGRLLCVFGCGGDRDKTKRPLMAKAVARHCDEAIITSDNPRGEKPEAIIDDVLKGIPLDFPHVVIVDRKEAIRKALAAARPGDCLIVAGKGHEDYQEIGNVRLHFDDKETIVELFTEAKKHHAA
jgi:UDP-N-acetylmuramoyl-L-alanyl-D-glutamate--2,6-diaminopimelate ligase